MCLFISHNFSWIELSCDRVPLWCFLGANAWQPLPVSLTGGSSAVVQSQQQCVKFTISHRTHCRNYTYVLTCVRTVLRQVQSVQNTYIYYLYFIFLAITGAVSPLITFLRCMFSLQIRSMTACRQVTVCWVILLVWCRGAEIQMWLQWNTTRRTRGATLTEVRQSALEVPKS